MNSHIQAAWQTDLKGGTSKLVLLALANYAGATGECWPPSHIIQRDTGLGPSTVRRAVKALEAAGLIEVERSQHRGHLTNRYRLKLKEARS